MLANIKTALLGVLIVAAAFAIFIGYGAFTAAFSPNGTELQLVVGMLCVLVVTVAAGAGLIVAMLDD